MLMNLGVLLVGTLLNGSGETLWRDVAEAAGDRDSVGGADAAGDEVGQGASGWVWRCWAAQKAATGGILVGVWLEPVGLGREALGKVIAGDLDGIRPYGWDLEAAVSLPVTFVPCDDQTAASRLELLRPGGEG
ncbi:hypothetical protein BGK72_39000 [Streptomyces agglomeratus]|nr:hypothetical protein BGK72_39000 [Streptomyces agglomeratus]